MGRVVEPYDTDKQINAYGFGANINPFGNKNVSHCFNLTLTERECVDRVEGVLQAYTQAIDKIQLYGPTNFADIINKCAGMAASKTNNQSEQNYVILLMITDGVISDMKQTANAIVDASDLPLSIIIIGVGNADFDAMEELDADEHPLRHSNGQRMKRDIVQFVPFNKFKDADIGRLAKEVLEEVPAQITGYMTMKKLHPLRQVSKEELNRTGSILSMYNGPSDIVRASTSAFMKNNMNVQAQPQAPPQVIQAQPTNINQPINPYYAQAGAPIVQTIPAQPQQQPILVQQPKVILVPQSQQQPQQTMPGYNPAATGIVPTAPTF